MLERICGRIVEYSQCGVIIGLNGFTIEVLMAPVILELLKERGVDVEVEIFTFFYFQMSGNRLLPVTIGFLSKEEREFFMQFISATGIGARTALKALVKPFSEIALAINRGDIDFLKVLPGIGHRKAKEIVASLQGKINLVPSISSASVNLNVKEEALDVLLQPQYKKSKALKIIEEAIMRKPGIKTGKELVELIFKEGLWIDNER